MRYSRQQRKIKLDGDLPGTIGPGVVRIALMISVPDFPMQYNGASPTERNLLCVCPGLIAVLCVVKPKAVSVGVFAGKEMIISAVETFLVSSKRNIGSRCPRILCNIERHHTRRRRCNCRPHLECNIITPLILLVRP